MNRFTPLKLRALIISDLFKANLIDKDYYGDLREYDFETAVLDQMLGQKLRFSASYSHIGKRLHSASDLLIHFGFYRVTALRVQLRQDGIATLRQMFGPRAATAPSLKLFEDIPFIGDLEGILATMELHFPDLIRAYAECLPADEKEEILAFVGDWNQEATEIEAAQAEGTANGITKQQVIRAFEGLHFRTDAQWSKALADVPKWLESCRVMKGKPGDKRGSALWNPVLIAVALLDKGIPIKNLDSVFIGLKDWADEWRDKSDFFRHSL